MDIKKDLEEKIINFGVFDYSTDKMASILNVSKREIETEMNNKESKFYGLFQKGKDMADYVIDLKLFEMAKLGDIKAMDKLEYRKSMRAK